MKVWTAHLNHNGYYQETELICVASSLLLAQDYCARYAQLKQHRFLKPLPRKPVLAWRNTRFDDDDPEDASPTTFYADVPDSSAVYVIYQHEVLAREPTTSTADVI